MSKCYHEEKGTKGNELHHAEPDLNCTCDVGSTGPNADPKLTSKGGGYDHPQPLPGTGPAVDPELTAKGSGGYDHPQPLPGTGPAADPKLTAEGSGGCDHPQTPEAEGPGK